MSVLVEGDMDFQKWYWDNYGDVAGIVSFEIYSEYLDYKNKRKKKIALAIFILLCAVAIIMANLLICKLFIWSL